MTAAILRLVAALLFVSLMPSLPVSAAPLDEYYLKAFGASSAAKVGGALQRELLLPVAERASQPHCGMPLKRGLRRDWSRLEAATQQVLAKQLAAPVFRGTELTLLSPSGRFKIHYSSSGGDAVPSQEWVQTVARTFDDVAASYSALGWRLPATADNAPYDVYLIDLSEQNIYGQTVSDRPLSFGSQSYTSHIEIDNDFLDTVYQNALPGALTAQQKAVLSLQASSAHEYHHAIQYGYNFFFDTWYAEATSTWFEDELYDTVNHLYNYIPAWFNNSDLSLDHAVDASAVGNGAGYGRWIFNRHLAERHGSGIVREFWERLAATTAINLADIPITPIMDAVLSGSYRSGLGDDFLGFTKRVYQRDWASHTADIPLIHPGMPLVSYERYPVNASSIPAPSITLPRYSFAYYRFAPSDPLPGYLDLSVSGSSGIRAVAFRMDGNGTVTDFPFPSLSGTTVRVSGINPDSEVVLLVTNVTNTDGHSVYFSTDGSVQSITDPGGDSTVPPATYKFATSGGGGGCFIATAAYGSYLHPRVRILREFRDEWLLTNAPGRVFVTWYYRLSPPLAAAIARHAPLRLLARVALTPLVLAIAHPVPGGFLFLVSTGFLAYRVRRKETPASAVRCRRSLPSH